MNIRTTYDICQIVYFIVQIEDLNKKNYYVVVEDVVEKIIISSANEFYNIQYQMKLYGLTLSENELFDTAEKANEQIIKINNVSKKNKSD